MPNPIQKIIFLLFLLFLLLAVLFIAPLVGSQPIDFGQILEYLKGTETTSGLIFFRIRIPRIFLAAITGASLALAGVIFQALLRNPLATPYTLGVSSGGALGAVLMIKIGGSFSWWGFSTIQLAAFAGSLATIGLVYYLARQQKRISVYVMILAGVTVSYFFGAMILLLHFVADFTETRQMIRWMMGGLDVVQPELLWRSLPLLIISYLVLFSQSRMLNILSTSEEMALSKGVAVERVQKIAFLFASLLTGLVVSISGPIGFVGLIIPHVLRAIIGYDHRYLIPASLFLGGTFLVICDTIARTVLAPVDIPVGVITAVIGGPFFLWVLIRRR
jgi:iron complex transport system permease protein